ncbi:MAG: DUF1015 family protein [Chitinophagaceae bacterium]|nr:DUF1015 family protein [Chitinophagaceae bacterium]
MSIIKPFRALRPAPELAARVASRPYDVMSVAEAIEEVRDNPYSFLRITRSEVDLPQNTDVHSKPVYEKAAENLRHFIGSGILLREIKPCLYIYQLVMNGRAQTGLVCLSSVEDYKNDIIKKHELTRPEKEKDRIDHILATSAQTGNVFLAYRDVTEINGLINGWKATNNPVYDFTTNDSVHHSVWIIDNDKIIDSLVHLFEMYVPHTYIADGHHRAASAAKVSGVLTDKQDARYFLTTLFPANQLCIWDYNRVVSDLNGLSPQQFLERLQKDFAVSRADRPFKPSKPHEMGLYMEGSWYRLECRPGSFPDDPIGSLDVSILSENILKKILGIEDLRTDKRIDFVGGIRGWEALEKKVNSGEMKAAFSLYPVTMEQLLAVADSGNIMPPKSTWFEPKLRDGLLTHLIEN